MVLATDAAQTGGVWRHLVDLASGLRAEGHEVTMALPHGAEALTERAGQQGLVAVELGQEPPGDVWHLHLADTVWPAAREHLHRAHGSFRATVLTEHLPRATATDPGALPGNRSRLGARQLKTLRKRLQYRECDRIICVSEGSRRFVLDRFGVAAEKVVTVTNGTRPPTDDERPHDLPPVPHFIAIGSVIAQKGYDVLLDAAAEAQVGWTAWIVGEGTHRASLQADAARRELPVEFLGHRDDVPSLIDRATAVVVPSRWESWGYVATEGMARGRAVVASAVDGLSEIVVDGETGLLVPPNDASALAAALDRIASDAELAARLGSNARRRVALFDVDTMIRRTEAVYADVLLGCR